MRGEPSFRRWAKRLAILACCLVSAASARAETQEDLGLWIGASGNGKFDALGLGPAAKDSPARWWFDTQLRLSEDAGGFGQGFFRPGIGYALDDHHTLWLGYAWIETSPADAADADFDEHRVWQQWTFNHGADRWSFQHRSRLEQRWLETGDDVGVRWRQQFRAQYKLTSEPEWSLIASDELFVNLNDTDWGAEAGFDQNRFFAGVGFKPDPSSSVRLEVGYLNQYVQRPDAADAMNHILLVNLSF